ncbi:MAG: hypothetical protein ABIL18_06075 [candidate division WOR-3 bacterium]
MVVSAKITGIKYSPFLCRTLKTYFIEDLSNAFSHDGTFILQIDNNTQVAVSWWVSPKRTRSYPYARVYDSLTFQGKKITIIPVMKDEGKDGDRDFLQWDTISLMSLLGVYTIIAYYVDAEKNLKFKNKITNQKFDINYIKNKLNEIRYFQSDALHWNLSHIGRVGEIANRALQSYEIISKNLKVSMHSTMTVERRIQELVKSKDSFMNLSRDLARKAQHRELVTNQPKEKLTGKKAILNIKNFLGGQYFFTCDEVFIMDNSIYLIEGKHSKQSILPSLEDIKDGLLKMILFTNLKDVKVNEKKYNPSPILKLTTDKKLIKDKLPPIKIQYLTLLNKESTVNNFHVKINGIDLNDILT